jgi:hypothetical protein
LLLFLERFLQLQSQQSKTSGSHSTCSNSHTHTVPNSRTHSSKLAHTQFQTCAHTVPNSRTHSFKHISCMVLTLIAQD